MNARSTVDTVAHASPVLCHLSTDPWDEDLRHFSRTHLPFFLFYVLAHSETGMREKLWGLEHAPLAESTLPETQSPDPGALWNRQNMHSQHCGHMLSGSPTVSSNIRGGGNRTP